MKAKQPIFILFFLNAFYFLNAQVSSHISTVNGLSTNSLTIIERGKNDIMWVGSYNGLNKFEGSSIKKYLAGGKYEYTLSSGEMHAVFEDRLGFIWLGTTAGVDKLNPVTGEIKHYKLHLDDSSSSTVGYIVSIWQDDEDNIWVGAWANMQIINYKTGQVKVVPFANNENGIISQGVGYKTTVKTKYGIWISTDMGMMFYEFKSKKFFHRYHNPDNNPVFNMGKPFANSNGTSSGMCTDDKNNIYFISYDSQLIKYNTVSKKLESFRFSYPAGAWRCCISVEADLKNNIWLGFRHAGLLVFDTESKTFTSIQYANHNSLIRSNYIYSICRDYLGNMWVATDNGLDIIDLYNKSINLYNLSNRNDFLNLKYAAGELSTDNTSAVYIPFRNHGGTFIFNLQNDSITYYENEKQHKKSFAASLIIPTNETGKVFASQSNELLQFNFNTKKITNITNHFLKGTEDNKAEVQWWYKTKEGNLFIKKINSTLEYHGGNGITKIFPAYGYKPAIDTSADGNFVWYIDAHANLIKMSSRNAQRDSFNIQQQLLKKNISFFNIRCLKVQDDNIWITCQNGLVRFHESTKKIFTYSLLHGLSHNFTFALQTDNYGRVWVASLGGIDVYDNSSDNFHNAVIFSEGTYMDGFGSSVKTKDGQLFFNSGNRLVRIIPNKFLAQNKKPYKLILTEVQINDSSLDISAKTTTLKKLPAYKNKLYFRFGLLDFLYPQKVTYSWYLEGMEKEWANTGNRYEALYNALPKGKYTFHVKATDANGNEIKDRIQVSFEIMPFWWQTLFFKLLCAVIAIGFLSVWYKWNTLRRHKREAQKMVDYFVNSGTQYSSTEDVLWDVARNCIARLNFEDCVIYLKDESRNVWVQKAAFGPKNPKDHEIKNPIEIPERQGIVGFVGNSGIGEIINNTAIDKRYIVDDAIRLSEITVPIIYKGKTIGVIDAEHRKKGFFKPYHLQTLTNTAAVCAEKIAIVQAQTDAKLKEEQLKELNRQMQESQLMAIRSQMNPHFLFNCLNAIQELIITKKIDEAYEYLSNFSKLLRMVLNNSEKSSVSLTAELQAIQLQLSLEKLRFNNSFIYAISIEDGIETDLIQVPPLLLQPFVENAIWHGLRQKEGNKNLWIGIKEKNEYIIIEIEDNGVGREQAANIKSKKLRAGNFESKGLYFSVSGFSC